GVVSAGGADSGSRLTSTGILVAAGPTGSVEHSSPIRDPAKGKAVATLSSPEPTSIFIGASIAVGAPIPAVDTILTITSVSAASSVPARTPIAAGVYTTADGTVKRFSTMSELMHWAGRADLMVLYGLVSDKYKTERATGIGLGLWMDLRTLITTREERDPSIIWDDQDQW
nr:hypothetical protein [Tanacetum cinerariifolium]